MQDTTITVIKPRSMDEPKALNEYFMRLHARYRSSAVMTPKEWPMNTPEGRASYWRSESRERFLNGHDLKMVIARAMSRLDAMPKNGEKIDFNELIYGTAM